MPEFKNKSIKDSPIIKIICDNCKIREINNIIENDLLKLIYFNKKIIHNILDDKEECIDIKCNKNNKRLSEIFYLDNLINDKKNLVNYTYNLDFIQEIDKENNKSNNKNIRNIIICKIILNLIYNYKGIDDKKNETSRNLLNSIEKNNKSIIENNLKIFKEYNLSFELEDILTISIEDLYIKIIISLLKNKKFENYDYIQKIFKLMDLESIDFTENMMKEFLNEINSNNNYIKDYCILTIDDLKDNKKINFYNILLNFIFKNSLYIYNIPFLYNTYKFILNLIKPKKNELNFILNNNNNNNNDIIKFIKLIVKKGDINYYIEKYLNNLDYINYNNNINNNNMLFNKKLNSDIKLKKKNQLNNTTLNLSNKNIFLNENFKNVNCIKQEVDTEFNDKRIELDKSGLNYKLINPTFMLEKSLENKNINNNDKNWTLICLVIINEEKYFLEENGKIEFINYPQFDCNINIINKYEKENKLYFNLDKNIKLHVTNKFINGNEDNIIFLDKRKKTVLKKITRYSPSLSINGLALIKKQFLLCVCKKYISGQKNGILLFNLNFYKKDERKTKEFFYDTGEIQITCICPIKGINVSIYFFAGCIKGKEISIKLFKIKYNYFNLNDISIEYIDDIFIKRNEYFINFEKPIKYIRQYKVNGHIFIKSFRTTYMLSPPNLEKYLCYEEDEKAQIMFEYFDNKILEKKDYYDKFYEKKK